MAHTTESTSTFRVRLVPARRPRAQLTWVPRKLSAYLSTFAAKLRELAPYAAIELILPGGSVMALLLWLYRRQKRGPLCPHH